MDKPRVKPLVWEDCGDGWEARTVVGEYRAAPTANTRNKKYAVWFTCANRKSWTVGYKEGEQAAKAAAQADYEARTLAAIEPAPVSVREAARVLLEYLGHLGESPVWEMAQKAQDSCMSESADVVLAALRAIAEGKE